MDTLYDEKGKAMIAGVQGGGGDPSTLAETAAKWGVTDPLASYGPDTLPPELEQAIGSNQFLMAKAGDQMRLEDARKKALRDAEYQPLGGVLETQPGARRLLVVRRTSAVPQTGSLEITSTGWVA